MINKGRIIDTHLDDTALVEVMRDSACGSDCDKCKGCGEETKTNICKAENKIGAKIGDNVVIYAQTKQILKSAMIVYIIPIILFLIGIIAFANFGEEISIIFGIIGFIIGVALAIIYNKKHSKAKEIEFKILEII